MSQLSERAVPALRYKPLLRVLTVVAAVVLGGILLICSGTYESFKLASASMSPTLLKRDHIFVNGHAFGWLENREPARGEIVVFNSPEHPQETYVKRVVGLPGDRITTKGEILYINDWPVPRCRAGSASVPADNGLQPGQVFLEFIGDFAFLVFHYRLDSEAAPSDDVTVGPFAVGEGQVFVVGDNRDASHDSRFWFNGMGGGVPLQLIRGRASVVWMTAQDAALPELHFIELDAPHCRSMIPPETCAGMQRCLADRPPRSATTPPPPH